MITSFQHIKKELVVLIDETFECLKGRNKYIKHLSIDNAGKNQAITESCKESDVKVKNIPPDSPKLNSMVKHGFSIRGGKLLKY